MEKAFPGWASGLCGLWEPPGGVCGQSKDGGQVTKESHLPACWAPNSQDSGLTELNKPKKLGLERRGQKNQKRERAGSQRGPCETVPTWVLG